VNIESEATQTLVKPKKATYIKCLDCKAALVDMDPSNVLDNIDKQGDLICSKCGFVAINITI